MLDERRFNEDDERLLQAFAASAATAVATAQNASEEALRRGIEASEAERTRWSRELHDDTLQQLASLRVILSGARDALMSSVRFGHEPPKRGRPAGRKAA